MPYATKDPEYSLDQVMAFGLTGIMPLSEQIFTIREHGHKDIWVRSRNCDCLVTWFCYQLIVKPGNKALWLWFCYQLIVKPGKKAATVPWPDPYIFEHVFKRDSFDIHYNKF